jgi:hypothetical protein
MERNRILELALEELNRQEAGIDKEIESIQSELGIMGSAVSQESRDPRKPQIALAGAPTHRAKSCLWRKHCTSIEYASIADYFSAKAHDPRKDTNSRESSL